jgi:NOL1/NOP2/fmu family ribosome biogenesis protein
MFLEQALEQTTDLSKSLKVLDLSAAPGGKSTHIQSLISKESLLVSNEVIRSRAGILKENIIKWGCGNVVVTNNDPRDFVKLKNYFDVVVVDAPCSGSGLFRREPEAINQWSENNVAHCCQRQQRILADAWPALKQGGVLIYSTCSYSQEEDEDILDWMAANFASESLRLDIEQEWGIVEVASKSNAWGYRFWPYRVKGEGFFIACIRKSDEEETTGALKQKKPEFVSNREIPTIEKWIDGSFFKYVKKQNTVYAWAEQLVNDYSLLLSSLHVLYSGTIIGELVRDKLIPHHALAMSGLVNKSIAVVDLTYNQAIAYLQRKELQLMMEHPGWRLVKYEGNTLGWINVLSNRINNYYPKELRILKDI